MRIKHLELLSRNQTLTRSAFILQLLIIVAEQLMRYKGVKTSGVPLVFWGLLGISSIVSLYMSAIHNVSF